MGSSSAKTGSPSRLISPFAIPWYVSPARPPVVGDHIVIQLQDTSDGEPGVAMVKLLVGKTPTQLKLAQYNPGREFNLALSKIKSIHKVLSLRELLGT